MLCVFLGWDSLQELDLAHYAVVWGESMKGSVGKDSFLFLFLEEVENQVLCSVNNCASPCCRCAGCVWEGEVRGGCASSEPSVSIWLHLFSEHVIIIIGLYLARKRCCLLRV